MPPVAGWEQLQIAFPALKQRLVPLAVPWKRALWSLGRSGAYDRGPARRLEPGSE